jgi:hypothetical protein
MINISKHSIKDIPWLEHLEMLLVRFSYLGIGADIASLSLIELWTVYRFLLRLADS